MPKRSNSFQRLIKLIETQLAPTGARVEESAFLPDLADSEGELVEIDTLIEQNAGARVLRTAIECRDCKTRKETKEWIRELKGKYEHLAVDRVVAVSRLGFSAGAARIAAHAKIELRSLAEAEGMDWAAELSELAKVHIESVRYDWEPGIVAMLVGPKYDVPPAFDHDLRRLMLAVPPDGGASAARPEEVLTVYQMLTRIPDEVIKRAAAKNADGVANIWVQLPPKTGIFDTSGTRHTIERFRVGFRRSSRAIEVDMTHHSYGEAADGKGIAIALGSADDGAANVAFVHPGGGGQPRKGLLRLTEDGEETVYDISGLQMPPYSNPKFDR